MFGRTGGFRGSASANMVGAFRKSLVLFGCRILDTEVRCEFMTEGELTDRRVIEILSQGVSHCRNTCDGTACYLLRRSNKTKSSQTTNLANPLHLRLRSVVLIRHMIPHNCLNRPGQNL